MNGRTISRQPWDRYIDENPMMRLISIYERFNLQGLDCDVWRGEADAIGIVAGNIVAKSLVNNLG